ncbi:lipopolysaccharide transport periplasmic protein LptA [Thalassovita sp.]|jgi:lipopolysaccharide export system protein LptA|uniref:lipopolysaccharide transport periplasmic protein LptA n=1 Tax=Thalassovita sp. TaxID=1979401 RepID=UPI003B5C17C9
MFKLRHIVFCLPLLASPALANDVAFGSARDTADQPVQVSADSLSVNQEDGQATFQGNVAISQGEMLLSAQTVLVTYNEDGEGIESLLASGGVTLVNGPVAAEAQQADYNIDKAIVVLTGNVLLTQGQNVISGEKVTINLDSGTAQIGGRVRTTLEIKE